MSCPQCAEKDKVVAVLGGAVTELLALLKKASQTMHPIYGKIPEFPNYPQPPQITWKSAEQTLASQKILGSTSQAPEVEILHNPSW